MILYYQNNFLHIFVYVVLSHGQYLSLQMQLQENIDKNCMKCKLLTIVIKWSGSSMFTYIILVMFSKICSQCVFFGIFTLIYMLHINWTVSLNVNHNKVLLVFNVLIISVCLYLCVCMFISVMFVFFSFNCLNVSVYCHIICICIE